MTGYTEDGAPVTSAGDGMDFYYNGTGYGSAYSACYTVDPDGGSREILYSRPSGEDLPNVYNLLGIYQGKVYFVSKDSDEHYDPVYNLYRIDAAAGGTPEFVVKLFEDPNYRPWYFRGGCAYGWQEDQICWIDLEARSLDFLTPDAQSLSVMTMRDLMYTDVADNGFLIGDLLIYYAIDDTIRACNVSTGRVAIIVSPGQLPDGTPVHIIPLDVEGATRFYYLKEEGEAVSFCSRSFEGDGEICYWSASY